MGAYYDEIEIEDMAWDDEKRVYHYPCPCGDRFEISKKQLKNYEDIATCPSCSLIIRVIYDPVSLSPMFSPPYPFIKLDQSQLDYEDEPSDDEEGSEASEEESEEGSDNDDFEDALDNFHISEPQSQPASVTTAA